METKFCKMHIGRHADRISTVPTVSRTYAQGLFCFRLGTSWRRKSISKRPPYDFSQTYATPMCGHSTDAETVRVRNVGLDGRRKDFRFFGNFAAYKRGTFAQTKRLSTVFDANERYDQCSCFHPD